MKEIFVDTWGWVALINAHEQEHQAARDVSRHFLNENYQFVTSNLVFSESYTLIRTRLHHQGAVQFRRKMKEAENLGTVLVVYVDRELDEQAWNLFERYGDKDFSFTDCTSFAIMQRRGIEEAFTQDRHFVQMGFRIFPEKANRLS